MSGFFSARNSSCGNVMFPQACVKNSVGGVYNSIPLGRPQADTPLGRHSRTGGTHPTGMHSCFCFCFLSFYNDLVTNEKK